MINLRCIWNPNETKKETSRNAVSHSDEFLGILSEQLIYWPSPSTVVCTEKERIFRLISVITGFPGMRSNMSPRNRVQTQKSKDSDRLSYLAEHFPVKIIDTELSLSETLIIWGIMLNDIGDFAKLFDSDPSKIYKQHLKFMHKFILNCLELDEESIQAKRFTMSLFGPHHNMSGAKLKSRSKDLDKLSNCIELINEWILSEDDTYRIQIKFFSIQTFLSRNKEEKNRYLFFKGASALIEFLGNTIRSEIQKEYSPGSIIIDGGGRFEFLLPNIEVVNDFFSSNKLSNYLIKGLEEILQQFPKLAEKISTEGRDKSEFFQQFISCLPIHSFPLTGIKNISSSNDGREPNRPPFEQLEVPNIKFILDFARYVDDDNQTIIYSGENLPPPLLNLERFNTIAVMRLDGNAVGDLFVNGKSLDDEANLMPRNRAIRMGMRSRSFSRIWTASLRDATEISGFFKENQITLWLVGGDDVVLTAKSSDKEISREIIFQQLKKRAIILDESLQRYSRLHNLKIVGIGGISFCSGISIKYEKGHSQDTLLDKSEEMLKLVKKAWYHKVEPTNSTKSCPQAFEGDKMQWTTKQNSLIGWN